MVGSLQRKFRLEICMGSPARVGVPKFIIDRFLKSLEMNNIMGRKNFISRVINIRRRWASTANKFRLPDLQLEV